MGVGAAKRLRSVRWNIAGNMILTWLLTFPGCGLICASSVRRTEGGLHPPKPLPSLTSDRRRSRDNTILAVIEDQKFVPELVKKLKELL